MSRIFWLFAACRGQECLENTQFSGPRGQIESHQNYGVNNYANTLSCLYRISAGENDQVTIEIIELDTENNPACSWDFLSIEYLLSGIRCFNE